MFLSPGEAPHSDSDNWHLCFPRFLKSELLDWNENGQKLIVQKTNSSKLVKFCQEGNGTVILTGKVLLKVCSSLSLKM